MEIKIAKKGNNPGTIGWLSKGLENGELILREGHLKNGGHHGLWLKDQVQGIDNKMHDGSLSQFLGAYNQYDLYGGYASQANAYQYQKCEEFSDRASIWTNAAWAALMDIAQQWCDICNMEIANENPVKIEIVRLKSATKGE